jgi:molecular chaperone HscB
MTIDGDTTLCFGCGKPAARQLVCPGCGVAQPAGPGSDYFAVFALPRKLTIDLADLERRYYALSRQLHPDLFHDRSASEQAASVRTSALVNRAYRTLRDPVQRALYWLSLHGESLGRDNERVPPALAARVFEVQEKLEELRDARGSADFADLERATREIQAELRTDLHALDERLQATFADSDVADGDGARSLAATKEVLTVMHYVRTLLRDVDRGLEPDDTQHAEGRR